MTTVSEALLELGLNYNPFPPTTTGAAFIDASCIPISWEIGLTQRLDHLSTSIGDKALLLSGGYGSGKTFILNWIATYALPERRVQPYSFDNPGVAFYDLANRLMRQIGRYELSKALWEMFYKPKTDTPQPYLTPLEFPEWLASLTNKDSRISATQKLATAITSSGLTTDEEIAHKFARVIVETRERPYYQYRDFVARGSNALVAEQEEASYFSTLIRLLLKNPGGDWNSVPHRRI